MGLAGAARITYKALGNPFYGPLLPSCALLMSTLILSSVQYDYYCPNKGILRQKDMHLHKKMI